MGGALTLALVRDGVLALDDPIARWLPEAADPCVLVAPRGPLDDTVPAQRPVTVRDLLAGTSGWGIVMGQTPLQAAMMQRGPPFEELSPGLVATAGRWGWTGGTGTTAYVDPARDTVVVLLTQRAMTSPLDGFDDFWTAVARV